MRLFLATDNGLFLAHMQRLFKQTSVCAQAYPVMTRSTAIQVFQALSSLGNHNVCLVVPAANECKLRLESTGHHFLLHCPAVTDCNSQPLTKAILTFLVNKHVDAVVLPMLGREAGVTARGMHKAIVDLLEQIKNVAYTMLSTGAATQRTWQNHLGLLKT